MIPRSKLIPLRKEFSRIAKTGRYYDFPSFKLLIAPKLPSPAEALAKEGNHYSVIVSKKISLKSVVRHQVKRRLCDLIMSLESQLPQSKDIVVMAKKEVVNRSLEELKSEMVLFLK